ncbi:MAG: hypothetical protein AB8B56_21290 [Crocinitomicaceae bacterium]
MRKYTKFIALGIILLMVSLSFATKNNLGVNFLNLGWTEDAKEISREEVQKIVKEKVQDRISESLTVRNPHLFMTKCYSHLDATLDDRSQNDPNRKFYENQTIFGTISLDYCGSVDVICKYQLSLNTYEIKVKESYLKPWVTLEEFQKQIETVETTDK